MLATLCNVLVSCDVDIPRGTLPPIVWHSPASFVGAILDSLSHAGAHHCFTCCQRSIAIHVLLKSAGIYRAAETLQDAVKEAQSKFKVPANIILVCLPSAGALKAAQRSAC